MCVAQFRDYCNAFAFKTRDNLKKDDVVDSSRGTFDGSGRKWVYTKSKSKIKALAKLNNMYAIVELERQS